MRRRSRAGGEPAKALRRKAVARKTRVTSKAVRRRISGDSLRQQVALLTHERDEALQQQTATADVLQRVVHAAHSARGAELKCRFALDGCTSSMAFFRPTPFSTCRTSSPVSGR